MKKESRKERKMPVSELDPVDYAIVDIEGIWLKNKHGCLPGKFSKHHYCQRKIAVLCWNGSELSWKGCLVYRVGKWMKLKITLLNIVKTEFTTFRTIRRRDGYRVVDILQG